MFCVVDFEVVLEFYICVLDMCLLWCWDYFDGCFILVFVGYQDECVVVVLELIYNWDWDGYIQGDGYGYLVIEVEDVVVICVWVRVLGYWVICEVGLMQYGCSVIVFFEDLDGYKVELIQKGIQFD